MDPGAIIDIVDRSLKLVLTLKDAFYGDDTSRSQLLELESRLQTIDHILRRSAQISYLAHDSAALKETVELCYKLLREYSEAIKKGNSSRANFQRAKLALLDGDRLAHLHERLTRHIVDLNARHFVDLNHAVFTR
jgi:hypothetical protein